MKDYIELLNKILEKAKQRGDKKEIDLITSELTIIQCDNMLESLQCIAKSKKRTII